MSNTQPTLPLSTLTMFADATVNGSHTAPQGYTFTLPGDTRQERQAEAERRIAAGCEVLDFPAEASLTEYRAEVASWGPEGCDDEPDGWWETCIEAERAGEAFRFGDWT